jgi:hypothetical protein
MEGLSSETPRRGDWSLGWASRSFFNRRPVYFHSSHTHRDTLDYLSFGLGHHLGAACISRYTFPVSALWNAASVEQWLR